MYSTGQKCSFYTYQSRLAQKTQPQIIACISTTTYNYLYFHYLIKSLALQYSKVTSAEDIKVCSQKHRDIEALTFAL